MPIDEQLISACKKGDRLAQNSMYKQCFPVLMPVCMRYAKNEHDAVNLLNESFVKIMNNLQQFKSGSFFEPWIKRITINNIIDHFRKEKKYKEQIHLSGTDYSGFENNRSVMNRGAEELDAKDVYEMIRRLPPMSRKVFNLFVIDGYSHHEISEMLGISEGTSKWHVSSARKSLKEKIFEMLHAMIVLL